MLYFKNKGLCYNSIVLINSDNKEIIIFVTYVRMATSQVKKRRNLAKISDFWMSRDVYTTDYYRENKKCFLRYSCIHLKGFSLSSPN